MTKNINCIQQNQIEGYPPLFIWKGETESSTAAMSMAWSWTCKNE